MGIENKSWKKEILRFYLRNKFSETTEAKVQKWLTENSETEELEQVSKEYWDSIKPTKDARTAVALGRVNDKLGIRQVKKTRGRLKVYSRVAAIVILLLGIGGILIYQQHAPNTMIKLTTGYGETKQVTLPDQTTVWLNAGSSLEYPAGLKGEIRSVKLVGEAFFSVTKDELHPFVVETKCLTVKVLGTKFDLKAYPEEQQTTATLQEGRIEVQTSRQQKKQLVPNEQLVYNHQTLKIEVAKIEPEDIPDWKNGNLLFADASLDEILHTLERHFNVGLHVDPSINLSVEHYTINFERGENLEQILQILTDVAGDFSFAVKDDQIVLQKR